MANYATLKAAIQQVIKTNGNNEITGALLQQSLLAMIESIGDNFQYAGIATPATNPGTPDQNIFYLASMAGTYTNFGGLVVDNGEIAILKYNGAWVKDSTGAASSEKLSQLAQEVANMSGHFYGVFSSAASLPSGISEVGYAYVGASNPFKVYVYDGSAWSDSGAEMDAMTGPSVSPFKGFFNSLADLLNAYPDPKDGDFAYVNQGGSPPTATVYYAAGGTWDDSGVEISWDIADVFPLSAKLTLLALLEKVAFIDEHGADYINDLHYALIGAVTVESLTAVFNTGGVIISQKYSLDDLRQYLTVTATMSDHTQQEVSLYTLAGSMAVGNNTITVTYMDVSTTFAVTVVEDFASDLDEWTFSSDGSKGFDTDHIWMKCTTAAQVTNYYVYTINNPAGVLWSAVNGKTVKVRIKLNDLALAAPGLAIFKDASATTLASTVVLRHGMSNDLVLAADGYYEATVQLSLSAFSGTITPTSASTFGFYIYARSQSEYTVIYDVQVLDVTP